MDVQEKLSWSDRSGSYCAKGSTEGFLIVGLLRAFTRLICFVNFREVRMST